MAKPIISINSISSLNLSVGINSEDFNKFIKASDISLNSDIRVFKSFSPVIESSNWENIFLFISKPIAYNILVFDKSSNDFRFDFFKHKNILLSIFIIFFFHF